MEEDTLKFVITDNIDLSKEEKEILLEAYHKTFIDASYYDIFDLFLKVTGIDAIKLFNKRKSLIKLADNYSKALDAIESINENASIKVLLIYNEMDELIGAGRLLETSMEKASVLDISLIDMEYNETLYVWKKAIEYIEEYLKSKGIEQMNVIIPFRRGFLVSKANEIGFSNELDNEKNEPFPKYELSKVLKRTKHVESNLNNK